MGSDDREIDSICLHMVARNLADVAIVDVDIEEGLRRRRQSGRTQESIQFHRDIRLLSRGGPLATAQRSEEHTSELQSLMRSSYAVFCLKKKKATITRHTYK